jgi:hypothetical protein
MLESVPGYCDSCTNDAEVKKESVQRFVAHAKRREKGIMKLISQSFCFEDKGFQDKNFKAIPEIDKERLKIIFDIAKELEPRSLFTMSLTYLSMFVEGVIGEECTIDFCDKLMAFTDKYVEEHYRKESKHGIQ